MLCFFQVEQIIHKCCLGVELLHYSTSTPLPVHQLDLESSNLEFQWIYYYVARWEKWSQGSTSPTQAGRFSTKTQAFFVYFNHTICLAYFDYNEFSFSQLAGRSSITRSKPPSSIRRLHTGGEMQARKSKCSKLINISFFKPSFVRLFLRQSQ